MKNKKTKHKLGAVEQASAPRREGGSQKNSADEKPQKDKDKSSKNEKIKPKYNMLQNSLFMIGLAFREKEKKVVVLALISAVLSVLNSLIGLFISPTIISAVESGGPVSHLAHTIGFFVVSLVIVSGLNAYVNTNTRYGRTQLRSALIKALNHKAAVTSYPNLTDEKFKNLLDKSSEVTGGGYEASEAIWATLTNIVTALSGLIIYLLLLTVFDPLMLAVIVITALAACLCDKWLNSYAYRYRDEYSEQWGRMWYIDEKSRDFTAAKDIRIFGLVPWLRELAAKALAAYSATVRKEHRVYFWGQIADLILSFLRNGIAYAYLIKTVLNSGMTVADFLLYFSAVGGLTTWISSVLKSGARLHRQSMDISTVRECLEYPEPFDFKGGEVLTIEEGKKYEITLENVSFKYPNMDRYILENINLTLHSGERLAVVGLNGAGKTTLVLLMCGFFDPTEGRVLLNGKDIKDYRRGDYYKLFSAVFQSFSLLAGSIGMNIAQSIDDIDMEKVRDCADKAGLLEKIEALPDGFNTRLNRTVYEDAMMLSGGEAQRLMLARALYKNAPIIVLDEPTAALDPIAESDMYIKYSEMTRGRSSVYISHRLASTRFCDRIILLDGGEIAEQGSHSELIALGGRYAELFEVQSRYYREEEGQGE